VSAALGAGVSILEGGAALSTDAAATEGIPGKAIAPGGSEAFPIGKILPDKFLL
jgi:hypothetical protein